MWQAVGVVKKVTGEGECICLGKCRCVTRIVRVLANLPTLCRS